MGAGKYIYCLINSEEERQFDLLGIGDAAAPVHTIARGGAAAVVSDTLVSDYPVSRANMLAHQRVMEEMMKSYTVLPVRFGTVAKDQERLDATARIRDEVLGERGDEFQDMLIKMADKMELGLKCLWIDMDSVFNEIVDRHAEIRQMKWRISQGHPAKTREQRITLGEKVKNALELKRKNEESITLSALKPVCLDWKSGNLFGDSMVMNASFLVNKNRVGDFDAVVNRLSDANNGRIKYKYVGPAPPCNFVELVIHMS